MQIDCISGLAGRDFMRVIADAIHTILNSKHEKLLRKRSYCLTASLSIIEPAKSLELTVFLPVCTAVAARQAGSTSSGDRESSFLHRDFIALI